MAASPILLVEDNSDDEALALRALTKNNIHNEVVLAHDGVEALDYLFGTGPYTGRDLTTMPQEILLDLKLPKIDGLQVLQRLRCDDRTRLLPVVILTSSRNSKIYLRVTVWGQTAMCVSRSTSLNLWKPYGSWGCTG
jgi:two-component system response regulator